MARRARSADASYPLLLQMREQFRLLRVVAGKPRRPKSTRMMALSLWEHWPFPQTLVFETSCKN
jgi:hypothetical protein